MYCESGRADWQHTANICAYLISVNGGKKVQPKDISPWESNRTEVEGIKLNQENFKAMKQLARRF